MRAVKWGTFAVITAAVLIMPQVLSVDRTYKLATVGVYAVLGLSVVVLTGWAGQVSLGQIAFFAIGATVGAKATVDWGLDLSLALIISFVVGGAVAAAVGFPALRRRGFYLAVATLAFSLATTSYFLNSKYFGWVPDGRIPREPLFGKIDLTSTASMYYVVYAVLVGCLFIVKGIHNSRTGRAFMALRDNERAAEAYGLHATRVRLVAFALSGALAGLAGCLYAHQQQGIDPDPIAPFQNLLILTYVIIGGVTAPLGAIIGAAYWIGLGNLLPVRWQILVSGIGVLIVLLILPERRRRPLLSPPRSLAREGRSRARHRGAGSGDIVARGARGCSAAGRGARAGRRRGTDRGGGLMTIPKLRELSVKKWLLGVTGGAAVFPLLVLFGLNAVDELDRTAFAVLLPNIRDAFNLNLTGLLGLIGFVSFVALVLQVPIAAYSDRHNRVRITWIGALAWAFFSLLTGLAWSIVVLGIARAGSGIGKAVVDPTHNSLIADYYDIPVRPRVYSFHRAANAVGSDHRTAHRRSHRSRVGLALAVHRLHIPDARVRRARMAAPRAEARRVRAPRRGSLRGCRPDRRSDPELRGVVAHRLEGREPAPHLVRAAVPRRVARRLLGARLVALRAGVRPRRASARHHRRLCRAGAADRAGHRRSHRHSRDGQGGPAEILKFLSHIAYVVCAALVLFATVPNLYVTIGVNFAVTGLGAILAPGIFAALSLAIPPRRDRWASPSRRFGSSPGSWCCRSSATSATTSGCAPACS